MAKHIAGIILCAGFSSRMQDTHKGLLSFGNYPSMLEKVIQTFKKAKIHHIYVVLGHKEKDLASCISHLDCELVYNADYETGMFSSVVAGISALKPSIEATFLMPVDAALVKASSLKTILKHRKEAKNKQTSVIIPTFLDSCGHPPLLYKKHFNPILHYYKKESSSTNSKGLRGLRGLRGYFASLLQEEDKDLFLQGKNPRLPNATAPVLETLNTTKTVHAIDTVDTQELYFLPITDMGIVCDIDTPSDYQNALDFLASTQNRKNPSISECFHILLNANLPKYTKSHCCKVALGSLRIGIALQKALKLNFSLKNCLNGGLLHDICRTQKKHALVGGEYLNNLGFDMLASIVASHTNLPTEVLHAIQVYLKEEKLHSIEVGELAQNIDYLFPSVCVFLADKFYTSDIHVTLEQRHIYIRQKFIDNEKALAAIDTREQVAIAVKAYFDDLCANAKLHGDAYLCVETQTNHVYEQEFLELFHTFQNHKAMNIP